MCERKLWNARSFAGYQSDGKVIRLTPTKEAKDRLYSVQLTRQRHPRLFAGVFK